MGPRASFQPSPPASRASRNSVCPLHIRVHLGWQISFTSPPALLRDIKRENILLVSLDVQSVPVVLRSVVQVTTTSLVCQCDVNMTFTEKKCSLWAKIFSIIMLEGESIFITSEGVGAEKYLEGCCRARGKRKVDFVNEKFCKQLTIRYLYLNAYISTLNSQAHRSMNAKVTQPKNLTILELTLWSCN